MLDPMKDGTGLNDATDLRQIFASQLKRMLLLERDMSIMTCKATATMNSFMNLDLQLNLLQQEVKNVQKDVMDFYQTQEADRYLEQTIATLALFNKQMIFVPYPVPESNIKVSHNNWTGTNEHTQSQ